MKCLKLTTKSWLLGFGAENAGLLFDRGNSFLYLSLKKRLEFATLDDVAKKFGSLSIEELKGKNESITEIDSFPIRHNDAVIVSKDPPLYNRGTNVVFAAGYWALKHHNGWTLAFCPKQTTISTYDSLGPFRNRLEALNRINSLNHNIHIESRN